MRLLVYVVGLCVVLFFGRTSQAQPSTYLFVANDKWGLCDSNSRELIPPLYEYVRFSQDKDLIAFSPGWNSDLKMKCYEVETGKIKTYNKIYFDEIRIADKTYHFLEQLDNKSYLKQVDSNVYIPLQGDILSIDNIGSRYLVERYFPTQAEIERMHKQVVAKNKTNKSGTAKNNRKQSKYKTTPPKIEIKDNYSSYSNYAYYYIFFKNSLPLRQVLTINADSYLPLYLTNEIYEGYTKNMRLYNSVNFDYIVFKLGNTLHLYDSNLSFVKEIPDVAIADFNSAGSELIRNKCSEAIGRPLYSYFLIPPTMGSGSRAKEEKVPDAFFVRKSDNGLYQLINYKSNKVIFESAYKFKYDNEDYSVDFINEKTSFYIHKSSGIPYLPQQYYKDLKLILVP